MPRLPRRHLYRTAEADLEVAQRIEKPGIYKAIIRFVGARIQERRGSEPQPLDHVQHLAYVLVAFVQDMMTAAGEPVAVYPSDLAGAMGIGESRAGSIMADLKRANLLEGSAAAGYVLKTD